MTGVLFDASTSCLQVYMVVMAHSTITAGKPLRPVNALIICCSAESSATIYKNKVMSLEKIHQLNRPAVVMMRSEPYVNRLKYRAVITPYRCLVHSVKTKPSGHFLLMIGPRKPNTRSGRDEDKA